MEMKKNSDVIKAFLMGYKEGQANNLRIEERAGRTALLNFDTVLAEIMDHGKDIHINKSNYGRSTTRIQNELIRKVEEDKSIRVFYYFGIDKHSKILV
jgi:hypothetical protein